MSYSSLNAESIIGTVRRLKNRIEERFPGSSLTGVASELLTISLRTRRQVLEASRPIIWLRVLTIVMIGLILAVLVGTIWNFDWSIGEMGIFDAAALLEASINDFILIGAGIFFLVRSEARIKRERAMRALHQLRSIAHVVDMHQLTKDPKHLLSNLPSTASSPERTMAPPELARYLEYCSEMLSLTGKLAALYAEGFDDATVLTSVNEIESLTTGLSRKVWQKLTLIKP